MLSGLLSGQPMSKNRQYQHKNADQGEISHLVIDATGLKVFGEGEWKVRQHGAETQNVAQTSSGRGQCDARDYQCRFIAQRHDGCAGTAGAD